MREERAAADTPRVMKTKAARYSAYPDASATNRHNASARPPAIQTAPAATSAAGTSNSPRLMPSAAALPHNRRQGATPRLSVWRRMPCSRSPEKALNPNTMTSRGPSACKIHAADRSPKRCSPVASCAGRNLTSLWR
ncbi:hypothetical protein G6F31_017130 [Rhizopus arrhizus]|nr:hypothetical protein G6F31_017130 [Rhizopus arrhizus]